MVTTRTAPPKYEVAYQALLERLKSGRYPVGARLPTEEELAQVFDVSRVTIRRSLDILVRDGFLERRQGSGYSVVTLSPQSSTCLTSFTDAMLRAGREPTSRLLSISHYPAGAEETAHLSPELAAVPVTQVERLRLVDGTPQMLVRTYAAKQLLAGAGPEDFPESGPGQSILQILSVRFRLDWSAACEDISPVAADEEMARHLQIEVGQPVLKQSCTAFDDAGHIVFFEDVYRTGMVSFNLTRQTRMARHS